MADHIDAALATAGRPCDLGTDPSQFLVRFDDWWETHSLLVDSVTDLPDAKRLKLLLLWGGKGRNPQSDGPLQSNRGLWSNSSPDNRGPRPTEVSQLSSTLQAPRASEVPSQRQDVCGMPEEASLCWVTKLQRSCPESGVRV